MPRTISLLLIGSLVIASQFLTKSETITENECLRETEGTEDAQSSPRLLEDLFITLVECLQQKIKAGIPSLRISSLDPLVIRIPIPLLLRNDILRGRLILRKFRLEGLAGFELKEGTVSITRTLKLGLNFDEIKLTAKYNAKLTLFGFMDIYGKGTLSIALNNFDIKTQLKIRTFPRLSLADLFLNVTLPTTHAEITGLLNDEFMSDIISRQLSGTLTKLAEEEHERFNTILHNAATSVIDNRINPALEGLGISDLLAIIRGLSGNCETPVANIVQTAATLIMDAGGIDFGSDLVYGSDYGEDEDDDLEIN